VRRHGGHDIIDLETNFLQSFQWLWKTYRNLPRLSGTKRKTSFVHRRRRYNISTM